MEVLHILNIGLLYGPTVPLLVYTKRIETGSQTLAHWWS